MPIVQLPDGTKINFNKTPTPQDVDFAYNRIKSEKANKVQQEELNAPIDNNVGVFEKIGNFLGGTKIAQGLAQAINLGKASKSIEETQQNQIKLQGELMKVIKEQKSIGADTSKLENALTDLNAEIGKTGSNAEAILNPNQLTNKEVLGDAAQLALLAGGGTVAKTAGKIAKANQAKTAIGGVARTAGAGAGTGAVLTGGEFAAQAAKQNASGEDIVKAGLIGAGIGLAGGGILSGIISGTGKIVKGMKLRQAVLKAQEESGIKPKIDETIVQKTQTNPEFGNLVKEAEKQGFDKSDINFLATIDEADKPVLEKMYEATVKAQSDPRQTVRAADILGDNAVGIVKQIESQNKQFGKAVDTAAKSLKGQTVDAVPVRNSVINALEEADVVIKDDGSFDFSNSIFKKNKAVQNKIKTAFSDLPQGEIDGFELHKFKKSIDEFIDFEKKSQGGLTGSVERLLKNARSSADEVLDSNFADYNTANTEFKATRDFLDEVQGVLGSKSPITGKQGAQAFGQAFRSAFSNNKSRGKTLQLIESLQNIAKERGLNGAEQNLLDQALYVNMLEEQFGSAAATGLAGEVTKAVNKARGAAEFVRNPVQGALKATAGAIEKAQNITPEMKKEILKKFIKPNL